MNRGVHVVMWGMVAFGMTLGTGGQVPMESETRGAVSLAGTWRFQMDPKGEGQGERWYATELPETVVLPGTMDENGKGDVNTRRDFTSHLSRDRTYEGQAWYQREIEIPKSWASRHVTLHLERTRFTSIWIDDRHLGDHDSLGCEQVFDLSGHVEPGRHVLTIRVDNRSRKGIRGGHMLTDHTQVNWNGILGAMFLRASHPVWIERVLVYPDLEHRAARVKVVVGNITGTAVEGSLSLQADCTTAKHTAPGQSMPLSAAPGESGWEADYRLGRNALLWDEFSPHLYAMRVRLAAGDVADEVVVSFGMREFKTEGTRFTINGLKTFLRGKHDALVWPLTGYAPMEVAEWERALRIAKSYGINHYRFHSCTPPAAAFVAADRVGIYMQPELYNFGGDLSRYPKGVQFAREEGRRILETYGNHPSFVMMTLGNEMHQGRSTRAEVIRGLRDFDPTRSYAQASNYDFSELKLEPEDDYWTTVRTAPGAAAAVRGSFSHADLPLGHIQVMPPSTDYDYAEAINDIPVPVIGHETGQFQVYPNLDEMEKYSGIQKPWNFEVFAERLRQAGMYDQWRDFLKASGALAVLCYREEIEAALRTPGFGGFQLLDLQDFPGQGTALVGILDAFMESKGLISPRQWREFCSPVVPLARMTRYTWEAGEVFGARLEIANYGPGDLAGQALHVRLVRAGGEVLALQAFDLFHSPPVQGRVTPVGDVAWTLPALAKAEQLKLHLDVPGTDYRNTYSVWVYGAGETPRPPASIHVLRSMGREAMRLLGEGESVLLIPELDQLSNSIEGFFAGDFWCFPMFRNIASDKGNAVAPGTLGVLCDPEHPALAGFPTESHSDWQWWHLVMNSRAMILDATPPSFRPVVQVIDNVERNHKLGLVFECAVGTGRLLICSIDLPNLMEHPEARQFYASLLDYMDSPAFAPTTVLHPEIVTGLFRSKATETDDEAGTDFREFFRAE